MGFHRKYNTIFKTVDNIIKLYKIAKKRIKNPKRIKNENHLSHRF